MAADAQFREFVAARYDALVRTARLLAPDAPEDLAQSALITTYTHWRRLRRPEAAEAYTRAVMARLALRAARRRWRGEIPTADLPEPAGRDDYAALDRADAVRRALETLPAEQRVVLVLRYYAQLSEAEIAAALGCSLGTVKSRASRAVAALRASGTLSVEASDG